MNKKSTESAENIISRLIDEIDLNMEKPDAKIKRQYFKAMTALRNAKHEFDLLNDLKSGLI